MPGLATTGSYIGRLPVFDAEGDVLTYVLNSTGGTLPQGVVSVDQNTGGLYLRDVSLLTASPLTGTVAFTVTEMRGNQTLATVSLSLPARNANTVDDDFRDSGSHRRGITFDLRPASVSAAGETLYTSLLKTDGNPLLPGESIADIDGGYTYGTYTAKLDGTLTYTPNATLYQDQYFLFNEDFLLPGISRLERPEQTLVLLAASGSVGAAFVTSQPPTGTTYQTLP